MSRNSLFFLICVFLLLLGIAAPVDARGGAFPRPESQGHAVQIDDELMSKLKKIVLAPTSGRNYLNIESMIKDIDNSSRSVPFSFSFPGRSFCFVKFNIEAEEPVACTVRSVERRDPFNEKLAGGAEQLSQLIIEKEGDTEHEIVFHMSSGNFTRSYISHISYLVSITQPKAEGDEGAEPSSIPFTVTAELLEPDFVKEGKVDPEDPRAHLWERELRDAYNEFVDEVERKYGLDEEGE